MVVSNFDVGLLLFALAGFLAYLFLSGLIWGAGYGPTPRRQLDAAASLLELKEGDTVYDLGCGFGRAVIYFAKRYHVKAIGVDIDPLHCFITKWSARRQGLSADITVSQGNLLDVDLTNASKVFFFLTPLLMKRVQDKVAREMSAGSRAVSVDHRFPEWQPAETVENVHLYLVDKNKWWEKPEASLT